MNLASWLKETITVAQPSGSANDSGEVAYSANTDIPARIERRSGLVRDINGNNINYKTAIATDQAITLQSKVWLPEQTPASDSPYTPVKVDASPDKNSNYIVYHIYI